MIVVELRDIRPDPHLPVLGRACSRSACEELASLAVENIVQITGPGGRRTLREQTSTVITPWIVIFILFFDRAREVQLCL
jgi:hypothetical protein